MLVILAVARNAIVIGQTELIADMATVARHDAVHAQ